MQISENTQKLFNTLKQQNLPKGKYVIFGSGAMLIRGLKDGRDVDVVVTNDIFEEYKQKEGWLLKPHNLDWFLSKDGIELWNTWRPGDWDINELIRNAEFIDDLPFVPLETTLKWKFMMGREKDLEHAQIIREYLKKSNMLIFHVTP